MNDRLRKIDRVLKVQQQLHKAAEVKLAGLQRQADELRSMQEDLIASLNNDETFHGLFVNAMAKRLQRLATQAAEIEAAKSIQSNIVFKRAMQVKRTEKLSFTLAEENRRAQEKKELFSILETLPMKGDASFP